MYIALLYETFTFEIIKLFPYKFILYLSSGKYSRQEISDIRFIFVPQNRCWGLGVDLIVSVPGFSYQL